jgi:aspartyl-tRNA(Asn)/glutamyl-tRNA(Gln) amidotransferase subunit C
VAIEPQDLDKLAHLAKIKITKDQTESLIKDLSNILSLVDQLQTVNTDGVMPMAHPTDAVQYLRADDVTETNQRERFQAIAPQTENGLYLVPRVIE